MSKYIVGITGASGSIYALRLIEELLQKGHEIYLISTQNGEKVFNYEMNRTLDSVIESLSHYKEKVKKLSVDDMFAPVASGSFKTDGMIIVPCSMATLAEIASGLGKNLLTRAADVCIKEKRRLILVPRETPLSSIHLKNMLVLSDAGVTILPAMPAFYQKPGSINDMADFIVGKIFDTLGIENKLFLKWGNNNEKNN